MSAQILSQDEVNAHERQGRQFADATGVINHPRDGETLFDGQEMESDQLSASHSVLNAREAARGLAHRAPLEFNEGSNNDSNEEVKTIVHDRDARPQQTRQRAETQRAERAEAPRNLAAEDRAAIQKVVAAEVAAKVAPMLGQSQSAPEDAVDYFTDPAAAVSRAVEAKLAPARRQALVAKAHRAVETETQRRIGARSAVLTEFNVAETLADPAFREWVDKSKVRQALLRRADTAYDLDAAREVFGNWKELSQPTQRRSQGNASRAPSSGKIFRRSEILKLMSQDPDKYHRLADEISRAYAENRVR